LSCQLPLCFKVLPWDIEMIIEDPSDEEEAESDESDEDSD